MSDISNIQIEGKSFIDVLANLYDYSFSGVEHPDSGKFKDAFLAQAKDKGMPWTSILAEYVHMADVAKTTSDFILKHGAQFKPEGMTPEEFQLAGALAGMQHDLVWVSKNDNFGSLDQTSLENRLLSLGGVGGNDNTSADMAYDLVRAASSEDLAKAVQAMVKYHGSNMRSHIIENGSAEGLELVLPIGYADGVDRVRDRYSTLALGTQVLNAAGNAINPANDNPDASIKKVNEQRSFVDTSAGRKSLELMDMLGSGYKQLPIDQLPEAARAFLIRTANEKYNNSDSEAILREVQTRLQGPDGTYAGVRDILSERFGEDRIEIATDLPPELYKREQKIQITH
jgi:hypothetical protein